MRFIYITLIAIMLSACDAPPDIDINSPSSNYPNTAYEYINQLRKNAGMIELSKQNNLANAALNHSLYLHNNQLFGHIETPGLINFTGISPSDRVIFAGYDNRMVGEGIAGGKSKFLALDNLFSAIYHRFTLLNYDFNEIGFGYVVNDENASQSILTHNMGNSEVNLLCQDAPYNGSGASNTSICKDNLRISGELYSDKIASTQAMNSDLVVWPSENSTDIPPVFFEETPDPLSDYSVSGYPISVQFNPNSTDVILNDFTLRLANNNDIISNTRLLTKNTDPNGSFLSTQFALFPLERLDWNTSYEAEISYTLNDVPKTKKWKFTTRVPAGKLQKIGVNETEITIESSTQATLYFVPSGPNDTIKNLTIQRSKNIELEIKYLDSNTLFLVASGRPGEIIILFLNARTITITLI